MSELLTQSANVQPKSKTVLFAEVETYPPQIRDFNDEKLRKLFLNKSFKQVCQEMKLTDADVDTISDDDNKFTYVLIRNRGQEYAIAASSKLNEDWDDWASEPAKFAKCLFTEHHPWLRNGNGELILDEHGNKQNDMTKVVLRFSLPNELKGNRERMFSPAAKSEE